MKFYDVIPAHVYDSTTDVIRSNANILYKALSALEKICPVPLEITSSFRSKEYHIALYQKILGKNFALAKVPMGSCHLTAQAVDCFDKNGKLFAWCKANENILETLGLWYEDDQDKPRVHFQTRPPKSGKRCFKP